LRRLFSSGGSGQQNGVSGQRDRPVEGRPVGSGDAERAPSDGGNVRWGALPAPSFTAPDVPRQAPYSACGDTAYMRTAQSCMLVLRQSVFFSDANGQVSSMTQTVKF